MKEELDETQRNDLIEYRLSRSEETLVEADYNAAGEYYNTAVNRLYYAAYYAASALMLAYGIKTSSHAGLKSLLSLHFVKKGKLSLVHGKTFMILFESRQSGDYEDFVYCDVNLYNQLMPKTKDFIAAVKDLVKGKIGK